MGGVGPFGEFAWDNPKRPMNDAIDSMAHVMGCPKGNIADHLHCLRRKHYEDIVMADIPTVSVIRFSKSMDSNFFP